MTKLTCGTCGPDGGRCEWIQQEVDGDRRWMCAGNRQAKYMLEFGECEPHKAYREQRELRENAEAILAPFAKAKTTLDLIRAPLVTGGCGYVIKLDDGSDGWGPERGGVMVQRYHVKEWLLSHYGTTEDFLVKNDKHGVVVLALDHEAEVSAIQARVDELEANYADACESEKVLLEKLKDAQAGVEVKRLRDAIETLTRCGQRAEARVVELEAALHELVEATKDYQGHLHSWELDEALENALCAADRALRVST